MLGGVLALVAVSVPAAQDSSFLMPEQSEARAKQIFQLAINAMGGSSYMNVHDVTCTGQLSEFDHSGQVGGFEQFIEFAIPPDKSRSENLPKRNIIEVYNGNDGWALDRAGVSDASTTDVIRNSENAKRDLDNILRRRIQEPDMSIRYGGKDVVDLHESDWVNLVDGDDRDIRIASLATRIFRFARLSRRSIRRRRSKRRNRDFLQLPSARNGIQTAFQITRERNGFKRPRYFSTNAITTRALQTRSLPSNRWRIAGLKWAGKEARRKRRRTRKRLFRDRIVRPIRHSAAGLQILSRSSEDMPHVRFRSSRMIGSFPPCRGIIAGCE